VKLPDVNLLLYATDETSPRFTAANAWLDDILNGEETVAFAWSVLLAYLRLTTKNLVVSAPLSVDDALAIVDGWLRLPNVIVVHPTDRHLVLLRELLVPLGAGGNLTADAHLAALAIEHGATLCSSDGDFRRFAGLRWEDPLG
jgi:toxin-antitoxin system PIN domain toxin